MFRDHEYLVDREGTLFCVAGDYQPEDAVLGMPYYKQTEWLEKRLRRPVRPGVRVNGIQYSKIISAVGLEAYAKFVSAQLPIYQAGPSVASCLFRVSRDDVVSVLDGSAAFHATVVRDEYFPLARLRFELERTLCSLFSIALTGSLLLGDVPAAHDLDVSLRGDGAVDAMRDICGRIERGECEQELAGIVDSRAHLGSVRRRNRRDRFEVRGRQVDVSFQRDICGVLIEYWKAKASGGIVRVLRVLDDRPSAYYPAFIPVHGAGVSYLALMSRGLTCALLTGDIVYAEGVEVQIPGIEGIGLAVDALQGHSIRVLGEGADRCGQSHR